MKFGMMALKEVEAKFIDIHVKACDRGVYTLLDDTGAKLGEQDGYVPGFFPGEHYGDYLMLRVDVDTGQIVNWKKPSAEDLNKLIGNTDE